MDVSAPNSTKALVESFRSYREILRPRSLAAVVDEELIRSILRSFQGHQDGMTFMYEDVPVGRKPILKTIHTDHHNPEKGQFASAYNSFCKRFREISERNNKMCSACDQNRAQVVLTGADESNRYKCHMKLCEITQPIEFAGKRRGVLFAGQRVIDGDQKQLQEIDREIERKALPGDRQELKLLVREKKTSSSEYSEFEKRFQLLGKTLEDTIQTIYKARESEALQHAINEVHRYLDSQCSPVDGGWEEPVGKAVKALSEHACEKPVWLLSRKGSRFRVIATSEIADPASYQNVATRRLFHIPDDTFERLSQDDIAHDVLKSISGTSEMTTFRVSAPPVSSFSLSVILLLGCELDSELENLVAGCARALAVPVNYAMLYHRLEDQKRRYLLEVSNTGHHLKTPIQSALFAMRQLESEKSIDIEQRVALAKSASMDLLMACAEALQLQTANLDNLVNLDLYDLIEEIVKGVGSNLAREYDVQIELKQRPPLLLHVKGSREHLRIVFLALIDNALKYSSRGRTVQIRLKRRRRVYQRRSQAVIDVEFENYGVGFDKAKKEAMFQEGGRADVADKSSTRVGVGLGLPMAKQLIEDHDGNIDIESEPLRGYSTSSERGVNPHLTTVFVTLPASD